MLYAKLSKRSNLTILCGACGNGLAFMTFEQIERYTVGLSRKTPEPIAPATERVLYRFVLIGEGWLPDSAGVWRPTNRARRQVRRGFSPQNRRRPNEMSRMAREDRLLPENGEGGIQLRSGFLLTSLPAEIVCIYCDMRQVLAAETLRADEFAPPGRWEAEQLADVPSGGSRPQRGVYPGAFPVLYSRAFIKGIWITFHELPPSVARWGVRRRWRHDGGWVELPVDVDPSAVAKSE